MSDRKNNHHKTGTARLADGLIPFQSKASTDAVVSYLKHFQVQG